MPRGERLVGPIGAAAPHSWGPFVMCRTRWAAEHPHTALLAAASRSYKISILFLWTVIRFSFHWKEEHCH